MSGLILFTPLPESGVRGGAETNLILLPSGFGEGVFAWCSSGVEHPTAVSSQSVIENAIVASSYLTRATQSARVDITKEEVMQTQSHQSTGTLAFKSAVVRSPALQSELRTALSHGDVVRIAMAHGYNVTESALSAAGAGPQGPGPTDDDLEGVEGALPCWCDPSVSDSKSC